jgi:SAM-dependent methyltransferase
MMLDLGAFSAELTREDNGIWRARTAAVSFPPEGYDRSFAVEDNSFWFRHRNACICEVVGRHAPAGPIFDVGGGNGAVAAALEKAGFATVLVEPGLPGAVNARRRGLPAVVCATVEGAGFRPHSLTAAGLFDVLEHIEDDAGFLKTLHGLLIPGGRLYLTVPAYQALWSIDDVHAGHFRRYTLAGLKSVLDGAGFDVDYRSYMFWFLPAAVFAFRTVPTWLGKRAMPELETTRQEHAPPPGWKGRLLDWLLGLEQRRIARGLAVPLGGSCLLSAHARRP